MEKINFVNGNSPYLNARNLNQLQDNVETAIEIGGVSGDTLPVGTMLPFGSFNLPANWLECNGQEVSRTEYALLFSVIGTNYGFGDGSTTFNLPDKRGRVSVGRDTSDIDFHFIGIHNGEKEHELTVDEMPSHTHDINSGATTMTSGGSNDVEQTSGSRTYTFLNVQSTGGGQPHNNLQPYEVDCWIIKAKQSAGVVANVVDNLNSTSATDALSANQGRILKENVLDSDWQRLELEDDFQVYGAAGNYPKYRKIGKLVEVEGVISPSSTISANTSVTIATLPVGYRPALRQILSLPRKCKKFLAFINNSSRINKF